MTCSPKNFVGGALAPPVPAPMRPSVRVRQALSPFTTVALNRDYSSHIFLSTRQKIVSKVTKDVKPLI